MSRTSSQFLYLHFLALPRTLRSLKWKRNGTTNKQCLRDLCLHGCKVATRDPWSHLTSSKESISAHCSSQNIYLKIFYMLSFLPRSMGKISWTELYTILNQSVLTARNIWYTGLGQQPGRTHKAEMGLKYPKPHDWEWARGSLAGEAGNSCWIKATNQCLCKPDRSE